MIRANEALLRILDSTSVLPACEVALDDALGRVIAAPVIAHDSVPPFASAAMDGFAVSSTDVAQARADHPVRLRVLQDVAAGSVASCRVEPGTAIRIMTGAPVPDGADCVVRVEDTRPEGNEVAILRGAKGGANVRPVGEDTHAGGVVLSQGAVVRAAEIGVLASVGCSTVSVYRAPKVSVVTTGDELVGVGEPMGPGKIRDTNSYALTAQARASGAVPLLIARVADTLDATSEAFARAMAQSDIVVTNGGVSVGDYDCAKAALERIGARLVFWGVEQKPGKPLAFWEADGKTVISLPGYPAAAMICFEEYVRPALRKMTGHSALHRPHRVARLQAGYDKKGGGKDRRVHLLRAKVFESDGELQATLTGGQGSAMLSSLARSNALVVVPEDQDAIAPGGQVLVHLTDQPEDH